MPTVGIFHTHFWENTGGPSAIPSGPPPLWNFPLWQSAGLHLVIWGVPLPSWTGIQERARAVRDAIRHWVHERRLDAQAWRICRRIRTQPDGDEALTVLQRALDSHAYPLAAYAVRKTATTLGFNRPEAWLELSRAMKRDPGSAENQYRHMEAVRLVRVNALAKPVGNPEANLLVEIAYQVFALKGK